MYLNLNPNIKGVDMKKMMVMAMVLGAAMVIMAGCGEKKSEPAGALDALKKDATAVAKDAKATGDKAAVDAKAAADKAAADAKAAAPK